MTFYELKLSHPAYTEVPGSLPPPVTKPPSCLTASATLQVQGKEREEDKYPGVTDYWGSGWKKCTHHPMTAIPESKQSSRFKKKNTHTQIV